MPACPPPPMLSKSLVAILTVSLDYASLPSLMMSKGLVAILTVSMTYASLPPCHLDYVCLKVWLPS